ncbi:MFS transporter [Sphingobium sp. AntQ-1]|uniref:MFS transporter n=1 Tax=Sphingobium sp. AntQ-1 TaxID=2930091 RepID=UPI00234EB7C6|nr:MFS transporter [Sphingobium sp. AntQ-1]
MTMSDPHGAGQEQSPRQAWFMVGFLTLLSIVSLLDRNIISLFMDDIKSYLQISDFQASLIYGGVFAITFSLMGLPMGWAVDRFSRRKVMFAGVSLWSIATAACGLVWSFPTMLAARALVGAGEAALVPSTQSIISDSFPPDRRTLPLSFYAMGQSAGAGIALLVGGALAMFFIPDMNYIIAGHSMHGWQIILVIIGLPGLVIASLVFAFAEPKRRNVSVTERQPGYGEYLHFMRVNWRYFLGHHGGFIAAQSLITAIMGWTPTFLLRVHGWTVSEAGLWFGLAIMGGPLLGLPIHGWLVDKLYQRGIRDAHLRYQLMIIPLSAAPLVAAYLVPNAVAGLLLLGLGLMILVGSAAATAASLQLVVSGARRGKAAAMWLLVGGLATFLGPSAVALLQENLFGNELALGKSLATYMVLGAAMAVVLCQLARLGFREMAVER